MSTVVIELHLQTVGAHVRLLPGRFSRRAEGPAAEPKHVPAADQCKPEHGKRNGDGERPEHEEEARNRKRRDASCLADYHGELARLGPHKEAASDDEKQEDRTTGKKIRHRGMPISRAARADGSPRRFWSCR